MWYVEQKSINKHLYGQMEQQVANDWPYCCVIADGNKMYYQNNALDTQIVKTNRECTQK